jgi:uncharacterized OsmC-like protein
MPGELMKGALASSIAIAIGRDAAEEHDLPIEAVAVHASSVTAWERLDGPLRTLTYLPKFTTRIVVAGALEPKHMAIVQRYARAGGVVQTMCNGVEIDEVNAFRSVAGAVRDSRGNSEVIEQFFSSPPPAGEKRITPGAPGSGVTAQYLSDGRALVDWARTSYLVDDSPVDASARRGARPEELLLASLCACTCVFTARAASLVAAPVEIRVAASGLFEPPALDQTSTRSGVTSMAKNLEVTGAITDEQRETLAFFADHCSLGETLRRGVEMKQEIFTLENVGSAASQDRASARMAVAAQAVERARAEDCDDGLCCVTDR